MPKLKESVMKDKSSGAEYLLCGTAEDYTSGKVVVLLHPKAMRRGGLFYVPHDVLRDKFESVSEESP